jgi:kinetochore protein Nuf2
MASGFGFPVLSTAEIAESLIQFGIAPLANLRPDDIAKPQPDLLPAVLSRFLASYVDAPG